MTGPLVADVGSVVLFFGEEWRVGMVRSFGDADPRLRERYYFLVKLGLTVDVAMLPEDALVAGLSA